MLLAKLLYAYQIVVLAAVVLSWIRLPPDNPFVRVIHPLTEPVFEVVRKILPATGGFDLSPLVVLIALQLLQRALF
jgi:YggT family protein